MPVVGMSDDLLTVFENPLLVLLVVILTCRKGNNKRENTRILMIPYLILECRIGHEHDYTS